MAARLGPSLFRACIAGSALVAMLGTPRLARADEPVTPEADTNPSVAPPPSARPNLVLVGAAVTAGWYGAAVGTSYLWQESDGSRSLRIPVAGPFMALAKTGCSSSEPTCDTFTLFLRTLLTGLSAVGQTGGVLAMLEGVFVPTSSAATSHAISPKPIRDASTDQKRPSIHFALGPSPTAAGASVAGTVFGNF